MHGPYLSFYLQPLRLELFFFYMNAEILTRAGENIKYHETCEKHLKLAVLHIKKDSACLEELQSKHETKSSRK